LDERIFVHFEFDDYKPKILNSFRNESEHFELNLEFMAPIGKWHIFFTQGIRNKKMTVMLTSSLELFK